MTRYRNGRFRSPRSVAEQAPLLHVEVRSPRSLGVSRGNRTRRLNEMRRAREAMQAALRRVM